MDSIDDVFRRNERELGKTVGKSANWPNGTEEDTEPVSGVRGPFNAEEDAMIAEIDRKKAEGNKKNNGEQES